MSFNLLVLLNKHIVVLCRIGMKERFSLLPNQQFVFCLEVFVHLEENLKASFQGLCSHNIRILQAPVEVGVEDIPLVMECSLERPLFLKTCDVPRGLCCII